MFIENYRATIFNNESGIKLLFLSVILLIAVSFGSSAHAEWIIHKRAQLVNKDKNILQFENTGDGAVYAWLILRPPQNGAFDKPHLPIYQIDNRLIHSLGLSNVIRTDAEKSQWIQWRVSEHQNPLGKDLLEFSNGNTVIFQYYSTVGTIKETTFDLSGIKGALQQILDP